MLKSSFCRDMSVEISFPSILRVAFRIHQVLCDSCTAETVRSGVKTRAPWSWVGGDPNLALPRCQTSFRPVSGFSICPLSVKPTPWYPHLWEPSFVRIQCPVSESSSSSNRSASPGLNLQAATKPGNSWH